MIAVCMHACIYSSKLQLKIFERAFLVLGKFKTFIIYGHVRSDINYDWL